MSATAAPRAEQVKRWSTSATPASCRAPGLAASEDSAERSALAAGYPTKQLFGPLVHEFWTADGVTRVSFLFFPRGSRSEVLSRAKAHRRKP